jgi:uncharacterized protein YjcR
MDDTEHKDENKKRSRADNFNGKRGGKGVSRNKGNKHGLKHGLKEHILYHTLSKNERDEWERMSTDVLEQLDHDIKLITIRERRMMERIAKLEESAFTTVKLEDSSGRVGKNTTEQRVVVSEASLILIQQIEEALTRVQDKKAKLIETKHKYESVQSNNNELDIRKLVDAIGGSVSSVWKDEEDGGSDGDT